MNEIYDVIIIGGGVVGCGTARELMRRKAKVLLLEKTNDICNGQSKANIGAATLTLLTSSTPEDSRRMNVNLDEDEAVCYLEDHSFPDDPSVGEHFPYLQVFTQFGHDHVAESYREGYFRFSTFRSPEDTIEAAKRLIKLLHKREG